MKESDYYPAGAYNDPNAPYNQQENDQVDFDVVITTNLFKNTKLATDQYTFEGDRYYYSYDTSEVDWNAEYNDTFYDVPQLLEKLVEIVTPELEELRKDKKKNVSRRFELEKIVESCKGWTTDFTEIELA